MYNNVTEERAKLKPANKPTPTPPGAAARAGRRDAVLRASGGAGGPAPHHARVVGPRAGRGPLGCGGGGLWGGERRRGAAMGEWSWWRWTWRRWGRPGGTCRSKSTAETLASTVGWRPPWTTPELSFCFFIVHSFNHSIVFHCIYVKLNQLLIHFVCSFLKFNVSQWQSLYIKTYLNK